SISGALQLLITRITLTLVRHASAVRRVILGWESVPLHFVPYSRRVWVRQGAYWGGGAGAKVRPAKTLPGPSAPFKGREVSEVVCGEKIASRPLRDGKTGYPRTGRRNTLD